eukprot:6212282-Pleurochrysis_carterae.AAC.2
MSGTSENRPRASCNRHKLFDDGAPTILIALVRSGTFRYIGASNITNQSQVAGCIMQVGFKLVRHCGGAPGSDRRGGARPIRRGGVRPIKILVLSLPDAASGRGGYGDVARRMSVSLCMKAIPPAPSGSLDQSPLSRRPCASASGNLKNFKRHASAKQNDKTGKQAYHAKRNDCFRISDHDLNCEDTTVSCSSSSSSPLGYPIGNIIPGYSGIQTIQTGTIGFIHLTQLIDVEHYVDKIGISSGIIGHVKRPPGSSPFLAYFRNLPCIKLEYLGTGDEPSALDANHSLLRGRAVARAGRTRSLAPAPDPSPTTAASNHHGVFGYHVSILYFVRTHTTCKPIQGGVVARVEH